MPANYDEIGYWSEIKLEIIRQYASAYSTIMAKHSDLSHIYIDAFAGPGIHRSRATGQFVAGSPMNALLVEPPFDEYHFIDADRIRISQLTELSGHGGDVFVHYGDCNEILPGILRRARYEDYRRALCVLDPYNIDLSWEVVSEIGGMRSVEIFLNFMVMDINMNVRHARSRRSLRKRA